jgi:hypothetical protein
VNTARSSLASVRNPVVGLRSFKKLQRIPQIQRLALRAIYRELAIDCRRRAEKCWLTHKAPMAAYWKAQSVYAGHIAKALR